MGRHHLIVPDQELHVDLLGQIEAVHELVVPVAGPAFVHDLGLDLRQEVGGLLVHDGEHVPLPRLEVPVVVADEQEQVFLRLERHLAQVGLDILRRPMEARERVNARLGRLESALPLLLRAELADRRITPAVHRQRMRRVEQTFDAIEADRGILDVVADAIGARLELTEHLVGARRAGEHEIVLEEVVVAVHVRDRQDLQAQGVVAHQIGETGIRIDDQLVRQTDHAMVVHGLGLLVALAVAPVRVVRRHAVIGGVAEHLPVVADLELLRVAVEAVLGDPLADRLVPVLQILDVPVRHDGPRARSARRAAALRRQRRRDHATGRP